MKGKDMATALTVYQASDGSRHDTEAKANERDVIIAAVESAMSHLRPRPNDDGCDFSNGHGYRQHDPAAVRRCKEQLWEIASSGALKWWRDGQVKDHGKTDNDLAHCHPSYQLRMLDGGCEPLSRAYSRLCCIDSQCREWGQPFYAINPTEAKYQGEV